MGYDNTQPILYIVKIIHVMVESMSIRIETVSSSDVRTLYTNDALKELLETGKIQWFRDIYYGRSASGCQIAIIFDEDKPVGYAAFTKQPVLDLNNLYNKEEEIYINHIEVLSDKRRKGHSGRLLGKIIKYCNENKISRINFGALSADGREYLRKAIDKIINGFDQNSEDLPQIKFDNTILGLGAGVAEQPILTRPYPTPAHQRAAPREPTAHGL